MHIGVLILKLYSLILASRGGAQILITHALYVAIQVLKKFKVPKSMAELFV